ncbi:MAG: signal transduction histidine kinase [Myxococcota bacterium]
MTGASAVFGINRLSSEVAGKLELQTQALLERIELRLSYGVESVERFARTAHVKNSLIDATGRSAYLPAAVRNLATAQDIVGVAVVDFAGAIIERSIGAAEHLKTMDVRAALVSGTSILKPSPTNNHVLIVVPIEYYRTTQGAVIVEVDLSTMTRRLVSPTTPFVEFSVAGRNILERGDHQQELLTHEETAGIGRPNLAGLQAHLTLGQLRSVAMAPVVSSVIETAVIGLVVLLLSVLLARRMGSNLAAPIRDLAGRVRCGEHPCGPTGTNDELEVLAMAFDDQTEEIMRGRAELETRVEERTRSLNRSNQELDEFAQIASHDLKEPLRGIHNYAQFLIEDYSDKLDEEGQKKLQTMARLTQRMEKLIDNLLNFSRLGRVELAMADVDLNATVDEIRDSLCISLEAANVAVRVGELPVVRCDRIRIAEVLRNLITNAMKYNDKDDRWIEVGCVESRSVHAQQLDPDAAEDAEDVVLQGPVFFVRDNGIGIRAKHLNAVFRIFKRLNGRDKFGGGHGVGLTIIKKVIARHGGHVWVESVFREGTTFWFTLGVPQVTSDASSRASLRRATRPSRSRPTTHSRRRRGNRDAAPV